MLSVIYYSYQNNNNVNNALFFISFIKGERTAMKIFRKRTIVFTLIAILVFSLLPGVAMAVDGATEIESCTCTLPCAEGEVNDECAVCSADLSSCTAKADTVSPLDETGEGSTGATEDPAATFGNTEGTVSTQGDVTALADVPDIISLGITGLGMPSWPGDQDYTGTNFNYVAATGTLTLTNYQDPKAWLTFDKGTLTVVLEGVNELAKIYAGNANTAYVSGNLTINGSGSLEMDNFKNMIGEVAIDMNGNFTLLGGTVTAATGQASTIILNGGLEISGGELIASSELNHAIHVNTGDFKSSGGTVTATSKTGNGIWVSAGDLISSGGTINATSTELSGIRITDGNLTSTGGTINASSTNSRGIQLEKGPLGAIIGNISVSAGSVTGSSPNSTGIELLGSITSTGGKISGFSSSHVGIQILDTLQGFEGSQSISVSNGGSVLGEGDLGGITLLCNESKLSAGKDSTITGRALSKADAIGLGIYSFGQLIIEATDNGLIVGEGKTGKRSDLFEGTPTNVGGSITSGSNTANIAVGSLSIDTPLSALDSSVAALSSFGITLGEGSVIKDEGQEIITLSSEWMMTHAIGTNGTPADKSTIGTLEKLPPVTPTATPRTSDAAHLGLWIALIFVAGAGLLGVRRYRKSVS